MSKRRWVNDGKKFAKPCDWYESQIGFVPKALCLRCGHELASHKLADVSKIKDALGFYPTFPAPDVVRERVRVNVPRQTRITEKAVLATLRHSFTNYEYLLHSGRWEYKVLKAEVNRLILEKIGDAWKESPRIVT